MTKQITSILLASLLGSSLLTGLAEAGPRKNSLSPQWMASAPIARGSLSRVTRPGNAGKVTHFEIKISKGNGRLFRGGSLEPGYVDTKINLNDAVFKPGLRISVPKLGDVSPLSATIWEGVAKLGTSAKRQPLRIELPDNFLIEMEVLGSDNPRMTRAEQFAQIVHEKDQADVFKTLSKLGYNPNSLAIKIDYTPHEHIQGSRINHFILVNPK